MNKYFKFFVAALVVAATAFSVVSCQDEEGEYNNPTHNGGSGK